MANNVAAISKTVTIADTAGTVTFDDGPHVNGVAVALYVSPVGTPSAANAKLSKVVGGKAIDLVASEAMSTTATVDLADGLSRSLVNTVATPLRVVFDTATNGNQWLVTLEIVNQ